MKIPPSTDEKYPTFIVITANMLDPSQPLVVEQDPTDHSQQISHTSHKSDVDGTGQVDAEPPWSHSFALAPHDSHMLFHSSLRDQSTCFAVLIRADAFSLGGRAANLDISSVELLVEPVVFEQVLAGQQTTEDDSKGDQKDAHASICACACGPPGHRIERCRDASGEDHYHGRHGRRVRA